MKKIVTTVLALTALGSAFAYAATREERVAVMRQNGGAVRQLTGIANAPAFDAAAAKVQLQILVDNAAKIPGMYGPDATSPDPDALKLVWANPTGFKAASDKMGADATAAMAVTDAAGMKIAIATLQGDCGGCHRNFRPAPAAAPAAAPAPAPAPAP